MRGTYHPRDHLPQVTSGEQLDLRWLSFQRSVRLPAAGVPVQVRALQTEEVALSYSNSNACCHSCHVGPRVVAQADSPSRGSAGHVHRGLGSALLRLDSGDLGVLGSGGSSQLFDCHRRSSTRCCPTLSTPRARSTPDASIGDVIHCQTRAVEVGPHRHRLRGRPGRSGRTWTRGSSRSRV